MYLRNYRIIDSCPQENQSYTNQSGDTLDYNVKTTFVDVVLVSSDLETELSQLQTSDPTHTAYVSSSGSVSFHLQFPTDIDSMINALPQDWYVKQGSTPTDLTITDGSEEYVITSPIENAPISAINRNSRFIYSSGGSTDVALNQFEQQPGSTIYDIKTGKTYICDDSQQFTNKSQSTDWNKFVPKVSQ